MSKSKKKFTKNVTVKNAVKEKSKSNKNDNIKEKIKEKLNQIKENPKKILEYAFVILEVINLLFLSITVQSRYTPYVLLSSTIIAVLFYIYKTAVLKEKININKIDLAVILFAFTYYISIIFKTYATFKGAMQGIMYAFDLISIYIVFRNTKEKGKLLEFICNTLILINFVYILIGIDIRTTKITHEYLTSGIGISFQTTDKNRFTTVLGYINANSVFMLAVFFITVYEYIKNSGKKILKYVYLGLSNLFLAFLILTYSRAELLIAVALSLVAIFMLFKQKQIEKKHIIRLILNNVIFAALMVISYSKLIANKDYTVFVMLIIYIIAFIAVSVIETFIAKKIEKITEINSTGKKDSNKFKYNKNNNNKNVIQNKYSKSLFTHLKENRKNVLVIGTVCISAFIIVAGTILISDYIKGEELVLDNNTKFKMMYFLDYQKGKECTFTFDFNVESASKKTSDEEKSKDTSDKEASDEGYTIKISEQNEYQNTTSTKTIYISEGDTKKSVTINIKEDTSRIAIKVNKINSDDSRLIITKSQANEKEFHLNYKYIPVHLVYSLKSLMHLSRAVSERTVGIQDGLKVGMKNFFTGTGNFSWRYVKLAEQAYNYGCTDIHCYPLVIFIENGIFGVIVAIICAGIIVFYTIKLLVKLFKEPSKENYKFMFLMLALLAIVLHSFIDFELSVNVLKVYFVVILALYVNELEEKLDIKCISSKLNIAVEVIVGLQLAVTIYATCKVYPEYLKEIQDAGISTNFTSDLNYYKIISRLDVIDEYFANEPFLNRAVILKSYPKGLEMAFEKAENDIYILNDYIDRYYIYVSTKVYRWKISDEITRLTCAKNFSEVLKAEYEKTGDEYYNNMSKKFIDIVKNDSVLLIEDAKNYKNYNSNESVAESYIEQINSIVCEKEVKL